MVVTRLMMDKWPQFGFSEGEAVRAGRGWGPEGGAAVMRGRVWRPGGRGAA